VFTSRNPALCDPASTACPLQFSNALWTEVMKGMQMSVPQIVERCDSVERENPAPREVLEELFLLLEEFGPNWYTEKHHERVKAALEVQ
jgi:hypothetical protein